MTDLRELAEQLKKICDQEAYSDFNEKLILMLVSNNWFGIQPHEQNGVVYVNDTDIDLITEHAVIYFRGSKARTKTEKYEAVLALMRERLPETTNNLSFLIKEDGIPNGIAFRLVDFLNSRLTKDLSLYNNDDIEKLVDEANEEMEKCYFDLLCCLLAEYRTAYKARYRVIFTQEQRSTNTKEAYSQEFFSQLIYKLFNDEYIHEHHMYLRAIEKPNCARTWLYLCFHLTNTVRDTDLLRVYHPIFPRGMSADDVLSSIKHGTFTDADALFVLTSVIKHLEVAPLTVKKTSKHSGIPYVKIDVPENAETHFGMLLAICEAHYQRDTYNRKSNGGTYFSPATTYEDICRYMGDDIGSLFIKENFSTISATKTVLQGIELFGDLDENSDKTGIHCKGYILAALARSHKGGYGTFAKQTATYLRDSKLNGMSPEFVAFELLSRGALSFVLSYMLRIITEKESDKLTVEEETKAIEQLGLTPYEANMIAGITEKSRKNAIETIIRLYRNPVIDHMELMESLHRIANNEAPAKQEGCMCLAVAAGKKCFYPDKQCCIQCEYEIGTQTTFLMMIDEFVRLQRLKNSCNDPKEYEKLKFLSVRVLTAIDEMLTCLKENYGEKGIQKYELIIKEKIKEVKEE